MIASQTGWGQTQTNFSFSWPDENQWQLSLSAQTAEGGTVPVSLIEFEVPYEDTRINQTVQTLSISEPYWFNPDSLCQVYVDIDTFAQIIYVRCERPQNSPLAGSGQVCLVKGGNTSVILDDIHPRLGLKAVQWYYDSFQEVLRASHLPRQEGEILLFNAGGQLVLRRSFGAEQTEIKLSVAHLEGGMYLAQLVIPSKGRKSCKFMR